MPFIFLLALPRLSLAPAINVPDGVCQLKAQPGLQLALHKTVGMTEFSIVIIEFDVVDSFIDEPGASEMKKKNKRV